MARGRSISLSPARRLVLDYMAAGNRSATVAIERRMDLSALVAARQAWPTRPYWNAIFLKAFGTVAARQPILRRCFMAYPWPHFYESPHSIATVTIERNIDGEDVVFYTRLRNPEQQSLADLDAYLRHCKEAPIEEIRDFRRAMQQGRRRWPMRPLMWWLAFNFSGKKRSRLIGTFGVTSVGALGAGAVKIITPLTSNLYFGVFDDRGHLDVRLAFDHRVLDGGTAARALADLEHVLTHETLAELHRPPVALAG